MKRVIKIAIKFAHQQLTRLYFAFPLPLCIVVGDLLCYDKS